MIEVKYLGEGEAAVANFAIWSRNLSASICVSPETT